MRITQTKTDLVSGYKVPHKQQNAHDHMFGNRYHVGPGNFEHLEAFLNSSVQVDMVRTDARSYTKFEVLGLKQTQQSISAINDFLHDMYLVEKLLSQVSRMKRRGDDDVSLERCETNG